MVWFQGTITPQPHPKMRLIIPHRKLIRIMFVVRIIHYCSVPLLYTDSGLVISDRDRSGPIITTPPRRTRVHPSTIDLIYLRIQWSSSAAFQLSGPDVEAVQCFPEGSKDTSNKFSNIIAAGVGLPIMNHNSHVYKWLDTCGLCGGGAQQHVTHHHRHGKLWPCETQELEIGNYGSD